MVTTPILRDGRPFAFRVHIAIPIQHLCHHIARFHGVTFVCLPKSYWKFFRWSGEATSQKAEFTFKGHWFQIDNNVPWTGECWVGPKDQNHALEEIDELRAHVDTLPLPFLHRPIGIVRTSRSPISRGILLVAGLVPATWFFFGPIAGFHHMLGFGITFYLVLNGENPQPDDHMWGEYAVRFFPARFAVGLALWIISVFIVYRIVRFLTSQRNAL